MDHLAIHLKLRLDAKLCVPGFFRVNIWISCLKQIYHCNYENETVAGKISITRKKLPAVIQVQGSDTTMLSRVLWPATQ